MTRRYRLARRLTQEDLADISGLSARALSDLERGRVRRPQRETVRVLAEAFGLDADERGRYEALARSDTRHNWEPNDEQAAPAMLPLEVVGFAGRAPELAALDEVLTGAAENPTAVAVAVLTGAVGVGKTTVAVRWAQCSRHHFPDGQLYLDLNNDMPTDKAMRRLLEALGLPAERIPAELGQQIDTYRRTLAGRRVMIVLDNVRDADQIRPLLPGSGGSAVLITSRNRLTSLTVAECAHTVAVEPMSPAEATELLRRRIGVARTEAEPMAVAEIVDYTAGLPLALAIVAARATTRPRIPLESLAADLRQSGNRLDAIDTGEVDLRSMLAWSYAALTPSAAAMFRFIAAHPGPDISIAAAASLVNVPADQVWRSLLDLVNANLLTEPRAGRYRLHDLLRLYAAELLDRVDRPAVARAAQQRLLGYYLYATSAASAVLTAFREQTGLAPGPAVPPPATRAAAVAWYLAERDVLLALVASAATSGFESYAWALGWAVAPFQERQGHWTEYGTTQRIALDAAVRLGERHGVATCQRHLGMAHVLGEYETAKAHLSGALAAYEQSSDARGEAITRLDLAYLCDRQGAYRDALLEAMTR